MPYSSSKKRSPGFWLLRSVSLPEHAHASMHATERHIRRTQEIKALSGNAELWLFSSLPLQILIRSEQAAICTSNPLNRQNWTCEYIRLSR